MKIVFDDDGWEDYLWWQDNDRTTLKRINKLIKEIVRDGNEGIGKPEPLHGNLSGFWSRRIDHEHRLVYQVNEDSEEVLIAACRFHYR